MLSQTSEAPTDQRQFTSLTGSGVVSIMFCGFLLRVAVAVWNGFFGPSFGAEADASTFHLKAVDFAKAAVINDFSPAEIYTYFLGSIYYFATDSLFLGSLLSCVIWLISARLLMKIMNQLSFGLSMRFRVMLIYALLPSAILFTSVTLREPYQLLFVNLAIYSILEITLNKSNAHWLLLFCAVVAAGLLHATLFAFGLFLLACPLLYSLFYSGKTISVLAMIFLSLLLAIIIYYGYSLLSSLTRYNLEEGLTIAIESYQRGGLGYLDEARAFYKTSVEIDGPLDLLIFVPVSLFQYLFEPMPWRIAAMVDIELFLENTLRLWLIWCAWVGLRNTHDRRRNVVSLLFLLYLVIEMIWSLGTINWGTAVRHHIPGMGILLVVAFGLSRAGPMKFRE